ncbi:MAG: Gfo/Idh/MocA family oxidoreductase [Pseudomonadota bacterium]
MRNRSQSFKSISTFAQTGTIVDHGVDMTGMQSIGVGVIGTGFMGKAHSIAYSASASVFGTGLRPRLEIVCDLSPARAGERATDLGFSRYSANWQEVVSDPKVQLVSICTPNDTHAAIAIAALQAGKHVWCEKPMAISLDECNCMCDAARIAVAHHGCKTIIGYNYTKNPAVTHARALIEAGAIGRIAGFLCRFDVDNEADADRPWSWRMSRAASGTGANGDVLSHVVSMAHFLTGSTITRVVGDEAIIHPNRAIADKPGEYKMVDNDDMIAALVRFANGVHGQIGASRVSWGYKCGLRWEVHGTKGTITHRQERLNELQIFRQGEDSATNGFQTILTGPDHPPYQAFLPNAGHSLGYMDVKICELHALLHAIEHDQPAWPDFSAGFEIEKVLAAIDQSAKSDRWIDV